MIGEQVNEVIDNLCQKIGSTQQMLVPEMARLCIARSWVDAAFCVVLFLLCSIGLVISIKKYREEDIWVIGIVAFSIFALVFFSYCGHPYPTPSSGKLRRLQRRLSISLNLSGADNLFHYFMACFEQIGFHL